MKKYEFTGEVITHEGGIILHRICALRQIHLRQRTVKIGELGGWIEKETNLSQEGDSWVSDNAMVYENSDVYGNAEVSGHASVFGNAAVSGNAMVSDRARVCENARVFGDAVVFGNAEVYENARVYGTANIYENAVVGGSTHVGENAEIGNDAFIMKTTHYLVVGPIGSRNDTIIFYRNQKGETKVQCGCFSGTMHEFLEKVKTTHGDNKHGIVYRAAANMALLQIEGENQ